MWKSIKKFFQSIAGRIASGWKWLFGGKANTTQENTSPEKPLDDKKHVNDQSKGNTVRIVNNEEVTTESEKFYDAEEELDDDFHDAREEDSCNVLKAQPRSITGEPEAQIHYISNPSKVRNGYC